MKLLAYTALVLASAPALANPAAALDILQIDRAVGASHGFDTPGTVVQ